MQKTSGVFTMKISTKGRYALRMLLDLAEHKEDGFIPLRDVAERQGISKKYLEQIVPVLSRAGLLSASRGFQGGYRLVREPDEYTVGEILRLSEGDLFPVACLAKKPNPCERCGECITLPVWEGLYRVISEYLDGMTLQDILSVYPDRRPEGGCCMDEEEQESRGGNFLP